MRLKKEELFFVTSFEQASILRKYAILFLVSSVIPMVLLYYVYFKSTRIGHIAMLLMVTGVLVGYFSIRTLLTRAISIAEENRKAIEPFLKPEIFKELSKEKNELMALNHLFSAMTKQLEANIKELRSKNEELKTLDRLKDDFVNNVSHELRLPLTVIQESIRQIGEGMFGKVNDLQMKYIHMSLRNIDRLRALIDNMLDIAKIEKGKLELLKKNVDVSQIIKEVISDFTFKIEKKGLALKAALPDQPLWATVDKDKITQVLINLVGNACKFTEKGRIIVSACDRGDLIECSVEDSGIGIPPQEMPHLFSKFHQIGRLKNQPEKGTGLGLVISKHIIELHNGQIHAQNLEGTGTKFTFTLPKSPGGL
ncbi:MAG: HAMP domain-containing histidine kinase [Candidatus Omnitrophica bacterium]|nr:HAMP domain-containing histidine kinase [Candidatus Omnitrophota bacterium]MDE2008801.1 HAMP domain-containing histidine kinase [Candidatus Omnitrophota bacterium]MDE2213636.1 HAMP domain-containing histidine kinase [Candidatus Omnitrophota bacterium]MDE2230463.1 HAMP domain-containing histidine kinase [Candidatus Omnitrophota bacterium]